MRSSPARILLSRTHWPVTALGFGNRVGIWFQGCSIGCKGCCAQDTWVADATKAASIEEVLEWIAGLPIDQIDGFTLTGGEPFDQPNALLALAQVIRRDYGADGARDILVYSGYPWRRLTQRHAQLLDEFDMVISEPFKQRRPGAWLRGSDNQAIHALTELGSKRYGSGVGDTAPQRSLQVHFDGEQLWMIGIPAPGDLERMEAGLRDSGVTFGEVSWG